MISPQLARALRVAGLRWQPTAGDRFVIERPGFEGDVFTVSDMTIEAQEFSTGTVLGFNGTTEWALDSVALDDALWLPAEHQLRALLASAFRCLRRVDSSSADAPADEGAHPFVPDSYVVETLVDSQLAAFSATDPADAYAGALLTIGEVPGLEVTA
ncbi:pilus assembly protein CpaE [Subtercola frigoramans]|uniref:Pilus assembly protein CpaE n=1 Tax=Subtercola frigoramans TaxID=120298 RepID=A0ABS2L3M2_9MICO|nr:pilus assembly protein CpaE [Subtercola frigoramans]MBM7471667.1 hypothetical protein [Subtercola frigoramans]